MTINFEGDSRFLRSEDDLFHPADTAATPKTVPGLVCWYPCLRRDALYQAPTDGRSDVPGVNADEMALSRTFLMAA